MLYFLRFNEMPDKCDFNSKKSWKGSASKRASVGVYSRLSGAGQRGAAVYCKFNQHGREVQTRFDGIVA